MAKANPADCGMGLALKRSSFMESVRLNSHPGKVNRNAFRVLLDGFPSYFRVDVVKGNRAIFLALFMATVRIL